jgi:hypothetical protein
MDMIINTTEIAIIIMLPMIIFYMRSIWNYKSYIFIIPLLYLIWYVTYGLLHEIAHMSGIWLCGKEIFDYQLIPHFWTGQFGTGYVNYDFQSDSRDFIIIILPYFRDLLFGITGYLILRKRTFTNRITSGLALILLVLSSLYDVTNNYLAYLMGYMNDFNALKLSSGALISNFTGITFMLILFFLTLKILLTCKDYPVRKTSNNIS